MKSDGKPHRKLKVWQAGMDFVVELYRELESFPAQEQFGLMAQLRRAAASIPNNIAEGAARRNTKELIQFLYIARGSLSELDTQLEICFRVGRLKKAVYDHLASKLEEMSMMLKDLSHPWQRRFKQTPHCSLLTVSLVEWNGYGDA